MPRQWRCPYCDKEMLLEREIFKCELCGRHFYERNDRLIPVSTETMNAMPLRKNIKNAENAYDEAVRILSNLGSEENRKIVAGALNRAGYTNVEPGDFEGARLEKKIKGKEDYLRKYKMRVYQLTIVISPQKAKEVEKKFRTNPNARYGGVNIYVKEPPFSALGGIRLSFSGEKTTAEHEDLHGTWGIYRGEESPKKYGMLEEAESYLLNEINSFRSEAMAKCGQGLKRGNTEQLRFYWNSRIKSTLLNDYLKDAIKTGNKSVAVVMEKAVKEDLEKIIPIIIELQLKYDESVLSRILIKSKTFADVDAWHSRKDILDQWQKGVIRQREMEVRKLIVSLTQSRRPNPDFIKVMILPKIREYWRFIGDPADTEAMSRYAERLISEASGSASQRGDVAKKLGEEFEDAEREGERTMRKIDEELHEEEKKEKKRGRETAKKMREEVEEIA